MLPSRVGTIDRNRPGTKGITFWERAVGVNRPYRRWVLLVWFLSVALSFLISAPQVPGQSKGHKKRARATATPTASPKGLVLPDFDGDGHLRGRFEAGTAHRIDQEHIGFQHLKITTYTPENQLDLQIDMHTSVLDLKTRVLSSQERTTIQRADFNIAGDSVYFDTNTRTGRLIENGDH